MQLTASAAFTRGTSELSAEQQRDRDQQLIELQRRVIQPELRRSPQQGQQQHIHSQLDRLQDERAADRKPRNQEGAPDLPVEMRPERHQTVDKAPGQEGHAAESGGSGRQHCCGPAVKAREHGHQHERDERAGQLGYRTEMLRQPQLKHRAQQVAELQRHPSDARNQDLHRRHSHSIQADAEQRDRDRAGEDAKGD
jgi:hypothetical protein